MPELQTSSLDIVRCAIELAKYEKTLHDLMAPVLSKYKLHENALFVLFLCLDRQSNPPSQSVLAKSIGLSPAQISNVVEQLRRDGLLSSFRDVHDRRRQLWRLTPEGFQLLDGIAKLLPSIPASCPASFQIPTPNQAA